MTRIDYRGEKTVLKGFKEFILRGNVIDLAVGVVIGAAFTAIVTALVNSLFNPLIGAIFNAESLSTAFVVSIPTVSGGTADLALGAVLAAIIQFLIVAAVVYFALVLPMNHLRRTAFEATKKPDTPDAAAAAEHVPPTEAQLLMEIRDLLAVRRADDSSADIR